MAKKPPKKVKFQDIPHEDDTTDQELSLDIRLSKDLKKAAALVSDDQARYLIDLFYQMQQQRIASAAIVRASEESGEPHLVTDWAGGIFQKTENSIKTMLDIYSDQSLAGRWAKSQAGIGPVIAAGLLAHIDIKRCPSVSALWRFAGFDPTSEWLGNEKSTAIVADVMGKGGKWKEPTEDQWLQLATATNRQVDKLKELARDEKTSAVTRAALIAALAKRPWNATLKTLLAFKLGESFVKVCNKPQAFYGLYYAQQKAKLKLRNAEGQFAPAAADILTKKNFHRDTVAKQHYQEGRLPDAHIHARARREAVKLFLSHYFEVLYEATFNKKAPKPYTFAFQGHVHYVPPPKWPCD
jgi:hypothetical protein